MGIQIYFDLFYNMLILAMNIVIYYVCSSTLVSLNRAGHFFFGTL